MTLAAAQTAAGQLRTALLDHGVRQVSIELQPGVGPKVDPWGVAPFVRGLGHHIVSRPPGTPGLALVKKGRTGANALQGPLCNGYGGFDLTARIITLGWANHPGEGGPWSVPGWGTVPKDNGRPYVFGWEFEGGIVPWTDEMHEFMARCGAGTLDWLGWLNHREPAPLECWGEHGHPWAEGRKIDRLGYTAASGRARIAAVRATSTAPTLEGNDDMLMLRVKGTAGPVYLVTDLHVTVTNNGNLAGTYLKAGRPLIDLTREEIQEIQNDVAARRQALGINPTPDGKPLPVFLEGVARRVENGQATATALQAAVAALASNGDLSAEQIEAAVGKALRDNVVKVDVSVDGHNA